MNELSHKPLPFSGWKQVWLLPLIVAGTAIGVIMRFLAPELMSATAIVGRVFMSAVFVVIVPLIAGQLALALNNPRERVRRGVAQSKILVRIIGATVVLIALSLVMAALIGSDQTESSFSSVLQRFTPELFVSFSAGGGISLVLALSVLLSAILGAMGDRAQFMVTICNRVSRASIRTFRFILWAAPIGLLSLAGSLGATPDQIVAPPTIPLIVSILISAAGLMLYTSIVLGIDWIMGQLRPVRKETRGYDRDRRPTRRTGPGPNTPAMGRQVTRERPPQRTSPEPRRERSPFEMGVSSTPVLDIAASIPAKSDSTSASPAGGGRRDDARPRVSREGQVDAPREGQRDGQRDRQRSGYRDRGPRTDHRDSGRDGFRDRGPRGPRGDDQGRDRGNRGFRPDHRDSVRPTEPTEVVEPITKPPRTVDAATASADLARVREQLNQAPAEVRPPVTREVSRIEPVRPEPIQVRPEPVRQVSPPPVPADSLVESPEVRYGRSRHRKYERPESQTSLPGIEQPPMPEMIDHYETDDMSFGRSKRRKTAK